MPVLVGLLVVQLPAYFPFIAPCVRAQGARDAANQLGLQQEQLLAKLDAVIESVSTSVRRHEEDLKRSLAAGTVRLCAALFACLFVLLLHSFTLRLFYCFTAHAKSAPFQYT